MANFITSPPVRHPCEPAADALEHHLVSRPDAPSRSPDPGERYRAAEVLACRSTVTTSLVRSRPIFFAVASRIRTLAWCGMSQSTSATVHAAQSQRLAATSSSTFTANLKTACPSICRKGDPPILPPQTLPGTERMPA